MLFYTNSELDICSECSFMLAARFWWRSNVQLPLLLSHLSLNHQFSACFIWFRDLINWNHQQSSN